MSILGAAGKLLGGVVGGIGQNEMLERGLDQYKGNVDVGTSALKAGQTSASAAFDPYATTGNAANSAQLEAVQGRQMAAQPTATNASAGGVAQWLNPMATWDQNQATKAATAAGVATGATGGGMQRAISADANKRAQTNWNDAYNQMLQANSQNFGQQQQQFANQTGFDQSQIENLGGIAQRGLSATGQNQGLQQGYNYGVNTNATSKANAALGVKSAQGQLFNNTATDTGNNLGGMGFGGLFSSILGG